MHLWHPMATALNKLYLNTLNNTSMAGFYGARGEEPVNYRVSMHIDTEMTRFSCSILLMIFNIENLKI